MLSKFVKGEVIFYIHRYPHVPLTRENAIEVEVIRPIITKTFGEDSIGVEVTPRGVKDVKRIFGGRQFERQESLALRKLFRKEELMTMKECPTEYKTESRGFTIRIQNADGRDILEIYKAMDSAYISPGAMSREGGWITGIVNGDEPKTEAEFEAIIKKQVVKLDPKYRVMVKSIHIDE